MNRRSLLQIMALGGATFAWRGELSGTRAAEEATTDDADESAEAAEAQTAAAESDQPGPPFSFDWLINEAQRRSGNPYEQASLPLEGDYASLSYDQYRDIRYKRDNDPWSSTQSAFALDLMPPGFLFSAPINISLVKDGKTQPLTFSLDDFIFGPKAPKPGNPDELTYSGFRLRSPINRPDAMDEVAVFQGASYFRAVARNQNYGLSARGLAVDTASERGEEFPVFTDFWIQTPTGDASSIRLWALLESPSVSGAYRFDLTPGAETTMQVQSRLFPRRDLDYIGVAPMTSMFLFDDSNRTRFDDFREAVHDSDGLQMVNGSGERVFRSLANPATLQISTFLDENPKGFGLVQRHRKFRDFEDAEARYDLRPSIWVQPNGKWGNGQVELVEIPTDKEIHDNITAYWRPDKVLKAGERQAFDYRLSWTARPSDNVGIWRVDGVRIGGKAGTEALQFVIDFANGEAAPADMDFLLTASTGTVSHESGGRLAANEEYRVSFAFEPGDAQLSEMSLRLVDGAGQSVSELWLYRWTP